MLAGGPDTALLLFPTKALAQDQLRSLRSWLVPGLGPHLRRRHLARGAGRALRRDGQRGAHQPRDAPRRDAPVPRPLGHVPDAAALRRGRRAARAAGRVRQPRGPSAAPAAPPLRAATAPSRRSASPPPRSATRPRWPPSCAALPVETVDDDGSPAASALLALGPAAARRGQRPPGVGQRRGRPACSPRWSARRPRAIAFCRSRRSAELVARRPQRRLQATDAARLAGRVAAYRGGYLARSAARSRRRCSTGELRGVVATTALELGVDIGGLDAWCSTGSPAPSPRCGSRPAGPGGRSSGRRARRRRRPARPVVHRPPRASCSPGRPSRRSSTRQPLRGVPHLACAAYELPLTHPTSGTGAGPASTTASTTPCASSCSPTPLQAPRPGSCLGPAEAPAPRRAALGLADEYRLYDEDGALVGTVDERPRLRGRAPRRDLPPPGPPVPGRRTSTSTTHAPRRPATADEYTQPRRPTSTSPSPARTTSGPSGRSACTSGRSR